MDTAGGRATAFACTVSVYVLHSNGACRLQTSCEARLPQARSIWLAAGCNSLNTQAMLCVCWCCRMDDLARTQNKLLMRLSQLRATEALFCDLLASCPAAAQQLPDLSYPLLTAATGVARAGLGSSSTAGAGGTGTSRGTG